MGMAQITVTDRAGKRIEEPELLKSVHAFPLEIAFTVADGVVATLHADGTVTGDYRKFVKGLRALPRSQSTLGLHLWAVANALAQQAGIRKSPLDL